MNEAGGGGFRARVRARDRARDRGRAREEAQRPRGTEDRKDTERLGTGTEAGAGCDA